MSEKIQQFIYDHLSKNKNGINMHDFIIAAGRAGFTRREFILGLNKANSSPEINLELGLYKIRDKNAPAKEEIKYARGPVVGWQKRFRVSQDDSSGVAAIIGKWPGDETDEDLLKRLNS